jgi:nitrogen fixation-related uncharacterized protein
MNNSLFSLVSSLLPVLIIVAFFYYMVKTAQGDDKALTDFISRNFTAEQVHRFLNQDNLAQFRSLVQSGKTVAAAKEYQAVTQASLAESRLAVKVTKRLLDDHK